MNPMEKWSEVMKNANSYEKDGMRYGQALMSGLFLIDKELYNKISDTKADCFYDDSKCTQFAVDVISYWYDRA